MNRYRTLPESTEHSLSTRSIEVEAIGSARDARRVARTRALTLAYWLVWVCVSACGLRWSDQTVLSLWWLVLAALWLTADLVRPIEELTGSSRLRGGNVDFEGRT